MKTKTVLLALFWAIVSVVNAQNVTVEQFMRDQTLQDSIVAAIVPNHVLMSKIINKIAENRQLHEMVIQHLTRLLEEKSGTGGEHDHASHETKSRYVGDEKREIKALSDSEVKALLEGEGMGMAMAAELNHYPGPRHVLDLADQLKLSEVQKKSVQESFARMHSEAIRLGKQLIQKEQVLERAFVTRSVNLESLELATREIEELRGQLRDVHLAAHLDVRTVLTPQQIESYDQLRGYTSH